MDKLLQVPSKGPTIDGLVPFAVVIGTVFLRTRKREIVLDWFQASNSGLVFNGVEDLVDRELQQSEVFH